MKVYVAGSFNHQSLCRMVTTVCRAVGHTVYLFCEPSTQTYHLSKDIRELGDAKQLTGQTALLNTTVQRIYELNSEELFKADAVVVVLPSGRSAHLEAGWAKGKGRPIYVYGEMKAGEWDAMYCMVDGIFDLYELDKLLDALRHYEEKSYGKDGKAEN